MNAVANHQLPWTREEFEEKLRNRAKAIISIIRFMS